MLLSIQYPSFISPEIIPGLPIRWYGLMYIVAFAVAFLLYRRQLRERRFPMSEDALQSMFCWGILGLILGARIFSTLVYEPFETNIYLQKPWLIFWPFRNGRFSGFQGMSYHGGVIGCLTGLLLWCRKKKYDIREIIDMHCASIPLGYTFGRLGNFFNAELYGRVTTAPFGMVFPIPEHDTVNRFNAKLDWVRGTAAETGIALPADGTWVNLPRHPSQLYEALFEGVVLWALIWLFRNRKPFKGFLVGLYLVGYGAIRFIIEYFREPDSDLGYRIQLGRAVGMDELARFHPLGSFSTGQLLCALMIASGVVWWIIAARLPGSDPIRDYGAAESTPKSEDEKKFEKNSRRKRRRKLR